MREKTPEPAPRENKIGLLYALAAFGTWGIIPIYFKLLQSVHPFEILCHRMIWSIPVAGIILVAGKKRNELNEALSSIKTLGTLLITTLLFAISLTTFIYAVNTERVLAGSLASFIAPLVNVLLGVVFLRETMGRARGCAILLAAIGTVYLVVIHSELVWMALIIAFSFSIYGFLRKTVRAGPVSGLLIEACLLSPIAAGFLSTQGKSQVYLNNWHTGALLMSTGIVGTLPMIWFTGAARRLPYSYMAMFQYLVPSLQFLLALFIYKESFSLDHLITFGCIWIALGIIIVNSAMSHIHTSV